MKIITLCGSLKFRKEIEEVAKMLSMQGNCVLIPIYFTLTSFDMNKESILKLKKAHLKRIELSDAIFVVNVNNYIGDSTNLEIEYAKKLGKEIMYYTDFLNKISI